MAFFDPSSESLIGNALSDGRVVFLVGPRRSGVTHWACRSFGKQVIDGGSTSLIDLAEHSTVDSLQAEIARRFGLSRPPEHPRDLQVLLAETARRGVTLFLNAHVASPETIDWLVIALLDSMAGGTGRGRGFIVEGAVDVDQALDRAFTEGWPTVPLIEYAASKTPWRNLVEIELVCDARAKRHHPALVPWLADHAGGDLGLVVELLSRIPETEILEGVHLEATSERVARSSNCALEIAAASRSAGSGEVAERLVCGAPVSGAPPAILGSGELKNLYLAGIAEYDPILGGYRCRAPLVARIVGRALGLERRNIQAEKDEIHSRASYLLWQIAHVELSLRSRVGEFDCSRLASETRMLTSWSGLGDRIKGEFVRRDPACRAVVGALASVLTEILPDRETILEAVRRRLGAAPGDVTNEAILACLTFRELVEIATAAEVVRAPDRDAIEAIGNIRNDVAHLRPTSYDAMHRAVQQVRMVLRSVWAGNA